MSEPSQPEAPPQYTLYRARRRVLRRRRGDTSALAALNAGGGARTGWRRFWPRGPIGPGRVFRWLVYAVLGWIALSAVLFLFSAQFEQDKVDSSVRAVLHGSGFTMTSANTILVLGSDARPAGTHEGGANDSPPRSDTIMLLRLGGGHSARLAIPRDVEAEIPGHGVGKINAAYALGGPALSIQTVEQYLGIKVNHVILINFAHFPGLIDAMGGIDYTGTCVVSKINGGFKNGGFTLRLPAGTHHINGKQALALARTRENLCDPKENDLSRARRQQKIFSAMKSAVLSPGGFLRLPLIAWNAPRAIESDMGATSLAGLFGAMAIGGTPPTEVLHPTSAITLSGPLGGDALVVSQAERAAAVKRFLSH